MRHAVFGRRLGRDTNARHALLGNLASALIVNGEIKTTITKAKFAQGFVEKLITLAKKKKIAKDRKIANLVTKPAFNKLISEIGPGFAARQGGYTRIIRLQSRFGDSAPMARIELLKFEKTEPAPTSKQHPRGELKTTPGEHPGGEPSKNP